MDGNKRNFLKNRSNPQFKKKGAPKRGKWQNSSLEESSENFNSADTVYRILCQSRKIGSVIGKGGNIIKTLREETQAKITVSDTVPGSDERVIIILSPSMKQATRRQADKNDGIPSSEKEDDFLELHCAAQDALLRVHDRIVEEDIGGTENMDENETVVTARLLVPNNMVGCLLGRKGDVIQRLRSETGANIRVLPAEHLPACALSTDELVQIQGKPATAKKALYQVSILLHENPRKDRTPLSFPVAHGTQACHPPGPPLANMPPGSLIRSQHNRHGVSPVPWVGGYGSEASGFGSGDYDDVPPIHDGSPPSDFTMKILCPAGKIGGVIGKGGLNVKQLQLETGASIHVEDVSVESDERVIRVSSLEALWNPRSQTIDAILQLQNRTSEFSEKGIITTRLLVPSSKVGCLLGQGGKVINEMRRRTQADIRVVSKEDKPKCASADEELVQISGSIGVAKDALAEIGSRLRTRCLRDANINAEPAPSRPVPGYGPAANIPVGGPPPPVAIGAGTSGRYELGKGGFRDYEPPNYPGEPPNYPGPPSMMGYSSFRTSMDGKLPIRNADSVMGSGGPSFSEIAETRFRLPNPQHGGSDYVDMRGSSEQLHAPQGSFQSFASSAGQSKNLHHGTYQSYNTQQSGYPSISPSPLSYQNLNPQHAPYQNISSQQTSYYNPSAQASYQY